MSWVAVIVTLIIIVIIIVALVLTARHERGDYNDGGGTQIGGNESIPFFAPANE